MSHHNDGCYRSEHSDEECTCEGIYDEVRELRADRDRLRAALERLASNEAMTVALSLRNDAVSDELRARLAYARAVLAPVEPK